MYAVAGTQYDAPSSLLELFNKHRIMYVSYITVHNMFEVAWFIHNPNAFLVAMDTMRQRIRHKIIGKIENQSQRILRHLTHSY